MTRLFGSPDAAATSRVPAPLTTMRGADLSFTLQLEAAGRTFSDGGTAAPVEQLLAARGANLVRLRLWVDPLAGTSDLDSVSALARRTPCDRAASSCRRLPEMICKLSNSAPEAMLPHSPHRRPRLRSVTK